MRWHMSGIEETGNIVSGNRDWSRLGKNGASSTADIYFESCNAEIVWIHREVHMERAEWVVGGRGRKALEKSSFCSRNGESSWEVNKRPGNGGISILSDSLRSESKSNLDWIKMMSIFPSPIPPSFHPASLTQSIPFRSWPHAQNSKPKRTAHQFHFASDQLRHKFNYLTLSVPKPNLESSVNSKTKWIRFSLNAL